MLSLPRVFLPSLLILNTTRIAVTHVGHVLHVLYLPHEASWVAMRTPLTGNVQVGVVDVVDVASKCSTS